MLEEYHELQSTKPKSRLRVTKGCFRQYCGAACSKLEIRNPKLETNSKSEKPGSKPGARRTFLNSNFEFVSDFEFRVSDFGPHRIGGASQTRPVPFDPRLSAPLVTPTARPAYARA